jgi:thymidylate kinase
MIVAIEGMDGVGKTTVAKSVEKDLLFEYVKDPLKELFEIDNEHLIKISDKIFNSGNDKLISWYLGLGDSYALSRYHNKDIVMDRHILLNYFWNGNTNTEKIFETLIDMFDKPDLTILLLASPATRMKRIADRNPNDPDLQKPTMREYGYDKMIDFLNRYKFDYIVIDTESLSIEETVEQCKKKIKEYRQGYSSK